jgi:hypothetical protein
MSYQILTQVIQELAEARGEYFRQLGLIDQPYRHTVTNQFFTSEQLYLGLLTSISLRQTPLTITFPVDFNTFSNPVLVTPTQEQITREIEPYMSLSIQQCSICQDDISFDGTRLRVCQHVFHRSCIQTWFGASVRCPICRRDIREDPASQTEIASTGILSQAENQLEEEDIEE